jgi:hypothetical protein
VMNRTNIFHTLCSNMGIKDFEWNMVLNNLSGLHKYIQIQMDLLGISSLGATYHCRRLKFLRNVDFFRGYFPEMARNYWIRRFE